MEVVSAGWVTQQFNKNPTSVLCVVTTPPPVPVVSGQAIREGEYKKKRIWQLDEIKWVDGRNEQQETHEFDMQVDSKQIYKWHALYLHERQHFLAVLHRQIEKNVRNGQRAEFRNVPVAWLNDKSPEKTTTRQRLGCKFKHKQITNGILGLIHNISILFRLEWRCRRCPSR